MDWLHELQAVGSAAYAMLLGGIIGYERELKNRPAGFRTHMLVAGASALLMAISQLALMEAPRHDDDIRITADPLRLVEAVISGVSFIGAGTIFARRQGQHVAGITTAASLLMVAVIGVMAGLDHYVLATAATVLTLVVLVGLNMLEKRTGLREECPEDDGTRDEGADDDLARRKRGVP